MTRLRDEGIIIKHPLSLNKWIDPSAPTQKYGDLVNLKNYIPERGSLVTRKGIESLVFTPQATVAPLVGNDFSGDANCLSWYKMSSLSGDSIIDEISGNHVTAIGTSGISVDNTNTIAPGLSGSISFDNNPSNTAYLTISYASMPQKFPGHVGENTTVSVCFWARMTYANPNAVGLAGLWNAESGARSWMAYVHTAFTTNFRWIVWNTAGGSLSITSDQTLSLNAWYHIKGTYSSADGSLTMRVLNSSGVSHYSNSATLLQNMDEVNQAFSIGAFNNSGDRTWTGQIQEVVVFNDVVSDAEQDQIIAGTYSP